MDRKNMGLPLPWRRSTAQHAINDDMVAALGRSQAFIEFEPDGTIITANENFLRMVGYELAELKGRHHSMLVDAEDAASSHYAAFWADLAAGQYQKSLFRRRGKGGREVWIEASYNPLTDKTGKVYRIVKVASDVTERHAAAADAQSQIAAISRSQAVIEFALDGTILTANENFCAAMGYRLDEIQGRHHRMFVRPEEAAGQGYAAFWQRLGAGEFSAGEFLRIGEGGRKVWIQASYNPIFDASGRPYKIVKYATDITQRKSAVEALSQSLRLLSEGNLASRIEGVFPGELEPVRQAFNETVTQLGTIVRQLYQTSSALRAASAEILEGSDNLAARTSRQAAANEDIRSAVSELLAAVAANAERARAAGANARNVATEAAAAGAVMEKANSAMADVAERTSRIASIIGLIDDIAFQTSLLALNASVEAARAGEAGKGFAVVAVEVRRLAQSAATASREIKGLIEQSGDAVTRGVSLVASASESLGAMVGSVEANAQIMADIAQANSEEAAALVQIDSAVGQMDEMTQHNAALAEETNAAIGKTDAQASRLESLVETFSLDGAGGPMSRRQPPSGRKGAVTLSVVSAP